MATFVDSLKCLWLDRLFSASVFCGDDIALAHAVKPPAQVFPLLGAKEVLPSFDILEAEARASKDTQESHRNRRPSCFLNDAFHVNSFQKILASQANGPTKSVSGGCMP